MIVQGVCRRGLYIEGEWVVKGFYGRCINLYLVP